VKKKSGFTQRQHNGGAARPAEGRNEFCFRRQNELWSADRRRVLREAEMRSVLMVVAHIFGHQPFQMALIQDDYVIQQVSSAASHLWLAEMSSA
jgi:hypothetical protein